MTLSKAKQASYYDQIAKGIEANQKARDAQLGRIGALYGDKARQESTPKSYKTPAVRAVDKELKDFEAKNKAGNKPKKKHRPWYIEPASVCIASVEYDGEDTLSIEWLRGGQSPTPYTYDVDYQTAKEMKQACRDGEAGEYANDEII